MPAMFGDARRGAQALVVMAGVLLTHAVAYLVAHPDPVVRAAVLDGHGYQALASALVLPAAAGAFAWLAVRRARRHEAADGLSIGRLAFLQTIVFVVVEVVERIPDGVSGVLSEPAIALGLLLQLPVAALLVTSLRIVEAVVAGFMAPIGDRRTRAPVAFDPLPQTRTWGRREFLSSLIRRGPPVSAA